MTRIEPDSNDILVWACDDTPGSYTLTNSGTAGTAGNLIRNLNPTLKSQGAFGDGLYFNGSSSIRDYYAGAGTVATSGNTFSASAWVNVRGTYSAQGGFNGNFVGKSYRNDNTWSSPWITMSLQLTSTGGNWSVYMTISGTLRQILISSSQHPFPLYTWNHFGATYDGITMKAYLNGIMVGSANFSGVIDYGTSGPWFLGSIPATGAGAPEQPAYNVSDIRIANVVRDKAYFEEIYASGQSLRW